MIQDTVASNISILNIFSVSFRTLYHITALSDSKETLSSLLPCSSRNTYPGKGNRVRWRLNTVAMANATVCVGHRNTMPLRTELYGNSKPMCLPQGFSKPCKAGRLWNDKNRYTKTSKRQQKILPQKQR